MSSLNLHLSVSLKISVLLTVLTIVFCEQVQAQSIKTDGSTGTNVTPTSNQFDISGGTKAGANLFHSFSQFGLNPNQIANFLSNPNIQNILARVTGGNASYINGIIKVSGGNSNLFLMNPAGIVFGASASLNVPASFTATTANGIAFGNNWFNASGKNNYPALVGSPSSFAFTTTQPGAIINSANLSAKQGNNLTLLGGTVASTGQLSAPGGNITVAAVPGKSIVRLSLPGNVLSLDIQPTANAASLPNNWTMPILSLPELLTGSGGSNATGITVNSSGQVVLIGSGLQVKDGDVVASSKIDTTSELQGGSVYISAFSDIITSEIDTRNYLWLSPVGNGGSISLNANGNITTTGELNSSGFENAGLVTIIAGGDTTTSQIWSISKFGGNGGSVIIESGGDIIFQDPQNSPGHIHTRSGIKGNAGAINLTAKDDIITGGLDLSAKNGNGGNLSITSNNGSITTGIILSGVSEIGNGGTISIDAKNDINHKEIISGTFNGSAGDITIKSRGNITISSGAVSKYFLTQCGTSGAVAVSCGSNGVTLIPTINGTTTYPGITWLFGSLTGKITIIGGNYTIDNPPDNQPPSPDSLPSKLPPYTDIKTDNGVISIDDLTVLSSTKDGNAGDVTGKAGGDFTSGTIVTAADNGNGADVNLNGRNITTNDLITAPRIGGNGGNVTLNAEDYIKTGFIYSPGKIVLTGNRVDTGEMFSNNIWVMQRSLNQVNVNDAVLEIEQQRTNEFESYFEENSSKVAMTAQSIQKTLGEVEKQINIKPAVIYIYVNKTKDGEELTLLMLTKEKIIPKNISSIKLNQNSLRNEDMNMEKLINEFYFEVSDVNKTNSDSYKQSAKKLYELLIEPIEPELQKQGITTLLFSLDGKLRSLPLAALYDGEKFLIEKYSLSLIPSITLTDTRYVGVKGSQVLAMGQSKFLKPLENLPDVEAEVSTIVNNLWSGKSFLNEEFTPENLELQRRQQKFKIIHLATHAEFQSGESGKAYIQMWRHKINLEELRRFKWDEDPQVELLVLSACRTALGDKEAEMGFAGLAVQAGVKSALASLWYSSDGGTLGLMTEFYKQLKNQPKAEALRQAQIAMLKGEVEVELKQLPPLEKLEKKKLSHPYYWAAFTMIGSPW